MIPSPLREAMARYAGQEIVFLSGRPLSDQELAALRAAGLTLTQRARFTGAERDKEMTIFPVVGS